VTRKPKLFEMSTLSVFSIPDLFWQSFFRNDISLEIEIAMRRESNREYLGGENAPYG